MPDASRPTLAALVEAAVDATAAARGWLLAVENDELVAVAAAGGEGPGSRIGRRANPGSTAGYVAGSGQPAALRVPPGDRSNEGAGGLEGIPVSVLAVPCGEDEVVAVLEVVNKEEGSAPFTIDDVEVVSLLAGIAGAALGEAGRSVVAAPSPAELAGELARLAAADSARYAAVAAMLQAVLGQT